MPRYNATDVLGHSYNNSFKARNVKRLFARIPLPLHGWPLVGLALAFLLPGLIGHDPWKTVDAIGIGVVFGLLNGLVHVYFRLPSFLATLAIGSVAASAALLVSGMQRVPFPPELRETTFFWLVGATGPIPNQILVGLAVLIFIVFLERYTLFGHWSRAIGSGEPAALVAGVPVNRVKITAMAVSGGMAGLAGTVLGARFASGSPTLAAAD